MGVQPTLLGVFAHPDDESFGPGGTLARYAAEGVRVYVVIATDGDAGSVDDPSRLQGDGSLAEIRAAELADAARALGLAGFWMLPYRDSGMRGSADNQHSRALIQQPLERLIEEIKGFLERLRPQVVITHDPHGGYGHPDHIRVCQATTTAFHELVDRAKQARGEEVYRPQKLYYTAFDKRMLRWMVRLMPLFGQNPRAFGRNRDIDLVEISRWDTPIHARVDVSAYLPRKEAASRAHASQYSGGPALLRPLPRFLRHRLARTETFTRAYPPPDDEVETDLFAGVRWE